MTGSLILTVIITATMWQGSLYVRPFGRCHRCKGCGHIRRRRGRRRVKICPRCQGRRRVQRRGSRTLHRAIFRIRDGRQSAAPYKEKDT